MEIWKKIKGTDERYIQSVLSGKRKTTGGYKFVYPQEERR
jgi:hypothetical protein